VKSTFQSSPRLREAVSRRSFLAALTGTALSNLPLAAIAAAQKSPNPLRIAALDWGLAATVLSLGIEPVGVPAINFYNRYVVDPVMPVSVVDVGLLFTPNFELLYELAPDLILITPGLMPARASLDRIGPLMVLDIAPRSGDPFKQAKAETLRLARAIDRDATATALLDDTTRVIELGRQKLQHAYDHRPVFLINVIDDRHIRIFGAETLYQDVLQSIGLTNAWQGRSSPLPLGPDALLGVPEARIIVISSVAEQVTGQALIASPFWRALPNVRAGRVHRLEPVLDSGGISSARRFAALLSEALLASEPTHG